MVVKKERIAIIGAGPIGLYTSILCAENGYEITLIETKDGPSRFSRAIGISPTSLDLFQKIGLSEKFLQAGVPIREVHIHGARGPFHTLGKVNFKGIGGSFPFILSIPQEKTEKILWEKASSYPNIKILTDTTCTKITWEGSKITLEAIETSGKTQMLETDFLIGCDGIRSIVQKKIQEEIVYKNYPHTFIMGDFLEEATHKFNDQAHLFFTPGGAIESFPLPDGKRRWIVQTEAFMDLPPDGFIQGEIFKRTGLDIRVQKPSWISPFGLKRGIVRSFNHGRIFLAGDAAHIISPIGGQGMNLGFEDAFHLSETIKNFSQKSTADYSKTRKRAFNLAANQTELSMALGTVRGKFRHILRTIGLWLFLNGPYRFRLPFDYAMRTLPRIKKVM